MEEQEVLPTEQELRALILSLTSDVQAETLKALLIDKIQDADCWSRCDLAALHRILRLILPQQ